MDSLDFVDPYVDPAPGILHNLVGATTQQQLDVIEGDIVPVSELRLDDEPPALTGDLTELCAIHTALFSSIYDWAGRVRTVDMRKNVDGSGFFVPVALIDRATASVAQELREDGYLHGLDRESFITRLAHHYDQLNFIHPFREGNGRTQRWFWGRVARDAGWSLSWLDVTGEINDRACRIATEDDDLDPLIAMFDTVVGRR